VVIKKNSNLTFRL